MNYKKVKLGIIAFTLGTLIPAIFCGMISIAVDHMSVSSLRGIVKSEPDFIRYFYYVMSALGAYLVVSGLVSNNDK